MALGKLDHMDFTVGDLEKAEEYFIEKLGFKFLRRNEHPDKSISSELTSPAGDIILQLHLGTEEELKKRSEQSFEFSLYINHIAFKVEDINKEFEELKSKGVSFKDTPPTLNPVTGRTLATAADSERRYWIQLTS